MTSLRAIAFLACLCYVGACVSHPLVPVAPIAYSCAWERELASEMQAAKQAKLTAVLDALVDYSKERKALNGDQPNKCVQNP